MYKKGQVPAVAFTDVFVAGAAGFAGTIVVRDAGVAAGFRLTWSSTTPFGAAVLFDVTSSPSL
jgi:hypothetical protein